jgi:AraC family transcriptional regulator, regulatory protein of adaptative response / methylated-DNA-[protein]-cysteine methyltransferase
MEEKMVEIIRYAQGDSSLGRIVAAMSDRGLAMVEFGAVSDALLEGLRARFPGADLVEDPAFMRETLARLASLIEHPEAKIDLPLDFRGTEFELRVWNALREIPAGRTVSYGEIAARIGSPRAAREVAEACAANRLAVIVPCHRVVKKGGSISGYRWGFKRKHALIERERSLFQLA